MQASASVDAGRWTVILASFHNENTHCPVRQWVFYRSFAETGLHLLRSSCFQGGNLFLLLSVYDHILVDLQDAVGE